MLLFLQMGYWGEPFSYRAGYFSEGPLDDILPCFFAPSLRESVALFEQHAASDTPPSTLSQPL